MIMNEWADITKNIGCDIFVIDFPLLDTRIEGKNLVGKFIADIVLQILSFVAQNERETIKQRQAEGIRLAKERGVHMGRPKYILPDNFEDVVGKYHRKEITNVEAIGILKMNRGTFFKYAKMYKQQGFPAIYTYRLFVSEERKTNSTWANMCSYCTSKWINR